VDNFANLAYGIVSGPPAPVDSGSTLTLEAGNGARFPAAPFQVTIWPIRQIPDPTNAEIASCTAVAGDTLTLLRAQQGTAPRRIVVGDQVALTVTKKLIDDLTAPLVSGRFLVQVPLAQLPGAQAMSALATGYLKNTTGTGVVSSAATIPAADLPNTVARTDVSNNFGVRQFFSPDLQLTDSAQAANQRSWFVSIISPGTFRIQPVLDSGAATTAYFNFTQQGDFRPAGDLYEKGRSTALGAWTTMPYNAANFATIGGGAPAWLVDSADQLIQYTLVGKVMTITFYIAGTAVAAGVAPYGLRMLLPAGATSAQLTYNPMTYIDGGSYLIGQASVNNGQPYLYFLKDPGGNGTWTAGGAQTINLMGQITIAIL
jgi:hypothetical protein